MELKKNYKFWFATGSQDLYGDECLSHVAKHAQIIVQNFNESGILPFEVVWKPTLIDSTSIRRTFEEANADEECAGVITWMHTFSPAKSWIAGLQAFKKPLLHLHTQFNEEIPYDTIDMDFMNENQSAHGDREFGHIVTRMGIPREVVVGYYESKEVKEKIASWMRSAIGMVESKNIRVVRIADNMRNVAVTEGDKVEAQIKFGWEIDAYPVNEVVDYVNAVSKGDIDALTQLYYEKYNLLLEGRDPIEFKKHVEVQAGIEIGLEKFLKDHDYQAVVTHFGDLGGLKQLPGLAIQRLMEKGYGVEEFETGEIIMDGKSIINTSPQEAGNNGISTVYQEVNLCPNLTVAENIFIGREPMKMGRIDWKTMNTQAQKILDNLELEIDATQELENYSVAIQQMVAIARAVDIQSKVLILDEPTSSLDEGEVEKLFKVMNMLKKRGTAIVFVTHFLEQVYAVCDRITVLRNGHFVGEYKTEELPRFKLVATMMGKEFDDLADIKGSGTSSKKQSDEVVIEAKGLYHKGTIKPFDIKIHKGEVVGLSGLLGSGRSELVRAIYGADKPDGGELYVKGEKLDVKAPIDAMHKGMAYCPEDRKVEGIIADLSVRENMILALQAKRGMFKLMSRKEQEELTDKYIKMLQVKTASRETPIKSLSGGNQQKVILGRWLMTEPDFLILDEPTRGIDVGTKTEIQKLVVKLANEGMSVVFISSEVEEMLRTVTHMGILRDGEKVGELEESELSQENVMKAIAGGDK